VRLVGNAHPSTQLANSLAPPQALPEGFTMEKNLSIFTERHEDLADIFGDL
jgi:hypothetical protein